MSASEKALDIQEKIDKYIDKLSDLGFEFMYYNRISSIRRIRVGRARKEAVMKIDKSFSIKDEGHLNKNNIIFTEKDEKTNTQSRKVNQNLGYYVLNEEDKWVKVEVEVVND